MAVWDHAGPFAVKYSVYNGHETLHALNPSDWRTQILEQSRSEHLLGISLFFIIHVSKMVLSMRGGHSGNPQVKMYLLKINNRAAISSCCLWFCHFVQSGSGPQTQTTPSWTRDAQRHGERNAYVGWDDVRLKQQMLTISSWFRTIESLSCT